MKESSSSVAFYLAIRRFRGAFLELLAEVAALSAGAGGTVDDSGVVRLLSSSDEHALAGGLASFSGRTDVLSIDIRSWLATSLQPNTLLRSS